jgi:hypothetical protein
MVYFTAASIVTLQPLQRMIRLARETCMLLQRRGAISYGIQFKQLLQCARLIGLIGSDERIISS